MNQSKNSQSFEKPFENLTEKTKSKNDAFDLFGSSSEDANIFDKIQTTKQKPVVKPIIPPKKTIQPPVVNKKINPPNQDSLDFNSPDNIFGAFTNNQNNKAPTKKQNNVFD